MTLSPWWHLCLGLLAPSWCHYCYCHHHPRLLQDLGSPVQDWSRSRWKECALQGGPSGRVQALVDFGIRVWLKFKKFILWQNRSATRWTTLYKYGIECFLERVFFCLWRPLCNASISTMIMLSCLCAFSLWTGLSLKMASLLRAPFSSYSD